MLHIRVLRPLTRAAALLAVSAALLAVPAAASATTAPAAQTQWARSLPYSCDFSAYGAADPVKVTATLREPTLVATGSTTQVSVTVPAITPPAAASQALAGVSAATGSEPGTVHTEDGYGSITISLRGEATVTSPGELPAITMAAPVTFGQDGYYIPDELGALTITPASASGTLAAITCTLDVGQPFGTNPISVATPGQLIPPGPLYNCSFNHEEYGLPGSWDITLALTGPRTTGHSVTVTLTADMGIFGSYGVLPRSYFGFTASLPVTGAQIGQIPLSEHTTDVSSTVLRPTAVLHLTQPGTDRIWFPPSFTFTQGFPAHGTSPASTVDLICKITPAQGQTWIPLDVTGGPATPSSPAASGTSAAGGTGGTAATGAVPAGAPSTGGGPRPGNDLPLALTGTALVLLGAALWYAARRRAVR